MLTSDYKAFLVGKKRAFIKYIYYKMIYAYIRVSTEKQTIENQRYEIYYFRSRRRRGARPGQVGGSAAAARRAQRAGVDG